MSTGILITFLIIITFSAISVSGYIYFSLYVKTAGENKRLRKSIGEIDSLVDQKVKDRTRQLENMRDSISNFAVQRFELAQELDLKNIRILEQKDITEKQSQKLQEAYEEIKKLETFRQQVVQMMMHDLKNPLNVILNLTDSDAIPARPKNIIRQISFEMLDLILNLLEVQKFKEMKMKVENENIHLTSLVEGLKYNLSPLFVNASVEFKTSLPQTCWIKADRHLVNRILINILSNAIKYTPSGGVIELLSFVKDDKILLEIRDNGNGIQEDQISRLFEMYHNGQNNDQVYNSSTGIGLAYCKLAVEAMGGTIGVSSEPGKGTTVWFTLSQGYLVENKVQAGNSETTDILIPGIELSNEEKEEIRPYIAVLKQRYIYEVTEILSVTKKIACCENTNINKWKELVEETLFSGNQKRFRELIEID